MHTLQGIEYSRNKDPTDHCRYSIKTKQKKTKKVVREFGNYIGTRS